MVYWSLYAKLASFIPFMSNILEPARSNLGRSPGLEALSSELSDSEAVPSQKCIIKVQTRFPDTTQKGAKANRFIQPELMRLILIRTVSCSLHNQDSLGTKA